jgi:hypothetical protein
VKKVITIQVVRPTVEGLTPQDRKLLIDELAKSIATQIVAQEQSQKINETISYWQRKLMLWELEEAKEELKYEQLKASQQKPQ